VFFYELREGDDDIFADVLLVREEEMDADSFFELVQEIRRRVQDNVHEQDTLIEAIAEELERTTSSSRSPTNGCRRRSTSRSWTTTTTWPASTPTMTTIPTVPTTAASSSTCLATVSARTRAASTTVGAVEPPRSMALLAEQDLDTSPSLTV
jgi:hypothetical protein